jgi:hypothetical protein
MSWRGQPAVTMLAGGASAQSTAASRRDWGTPSMRGQDLAAVRAGPGAPGQLAAQHLYEGQVEAAVSGAQAAGPRRAGWHGAHAARVRGSSWPRSGKARGVLAGSR